MLGGPELEGQSLEGLEHPLLGLLDNILWTRML